MSSTGFVDDFTMEGIKNASFPVLQKTCYNQEIGQKPGGQKPGLECFKYFGVSYKNILYFLSMSDKVKVARINIDEGPQSRVFIPDSQIPYKYFRGIVHGTQVGVQFIFF